MALRKPSTVFNVYDVLVATLKVMEDRGTYVSKKASEVTGETPTSQFVIAYLKGNPTIPEDNRTKYFNQAEEIANHFRQPPSGFDDFLEKVYTILVSGAVTDKMIGFVTALPWMYQNLTNRTSKLMKIAQKYASSNYMGELGTRDSFFVKLLDVNEFTKKTTGQPDEKVYIYRIADQGGNYGIFFSSHPPESEMLPVKVWDCFEMKATPKKQQPNRETGIKETQFSHVKVMEVLGQGSEE
jgi:hypothetical protein